ncbi:unnamed protein product, partial [marine sediment metagenome]
VETRPRVAEKRRWIALRVLEHFPETRADELAPDDLRRFEAALLREPSRAFRRRGQPLSTHSVRDAAIGLNSILIWAEQAGWMPPGSTPRHRPAKPRQSAPVLVSAERWAQKGEFRP